MPFGIIPESRSASPESPREGDRVRCASGQYDYRMLLDNWQKWCRLNGATAAQVAASSRVARKIAAA